MKNKIKIIIITEILIKIKKLKIIFNFMIKTVILLKFIIKKG